MDKKELSLNTNLGNEYNLNETLALIKNADSFEEVADDEAVKTGKQNGLIGRD